MPTSYTQGVAVTAMFYPRLIAHLFTRVVVYTVVCAIGLGWFGALDGAISGSALMLFFSLSAPFKIMGNLPGMLAGGGLYGGLCGGFSGVTWGAIVGLVAALAFGRRPCSKWELLQLLRGAFLGALLGIGIGLIFGIIVLPALHALAMRLLFWGTTSASTNLVTTWHTEALSFSILSIIGGFTFGSGLGAWAHTSGITRERMRQLLILMGPLPSFLVSNLLVPRYDPHLPSWEEIK